MKEKELKGLEGWLGFFGALFIVHMIIILGYFLVALGENFYMAIWNLVFFIYAIFIFVLYVGEKKKFIMHIKIYLWAGIILVILTYVFPMVSASATNRGSIIWLLYFYNSRRVKNTFVK